ncbi:hypothetical protein C4J81_04655 [Deltaproteobacteria bacterium Smac51]|nr:hypothetical protein C4J81_04655 [Deltaproteobacteria bacterium Smac51]
MKTTVGERIKQIRGKTPLPVFAEILGVSPHTIMRYESGKTAPAADFIFRLCEHYKVSPNWIFYGNDNSKYGSTNNAMANVQHTQKPLLNLEINDAEITESMIVNLTGIAFDNLWKEFRQESESRRGWTQIEIVKRFPEFMAWVRENPQYITALHTVALNRGGMEYHGVGAMELEDD